MATICPASLFQTLFLFRGKSDSLSFEDWISGGGEVLPQAMQKRRQWWCFSFLGVEASRDAGEVGVEQLVPVGFHQHCWCSD